MNGLKGTIGQTPKLRGQINVPVITQGAGENGATFIPAVSEEGVISWTNNKGLANPPAVNIKGPKGDTGEAGYTPIKGTDYWTEADKAEIVEEVLASGGGTGGASGGETWEVIQEIEVTEDVAELFVSTDLNGNAFKLKKVFADFTVYSPSDTATGNILVSMNRGKTSASTNIIYTGANASNGRCFWLHMDCDIKLVLRFMEGWANNLSQNISAQAMTPTYTAKNVLNGLDYVESMVISAPTALAVGTKIKLWGVRV